MRAAAGGGVCGDSDCLTHVGSQGQRSAAIPGTVSAVAGSCSVASMRIRVHEENGRQLDNQ